jgi:AraC-like DNA-binding protein
LGDPERVAQVNNGPATWQTGVIRMTGRSPETMAEIADALRLACDAAVGVGAELYDADDGLEIGCERLGVDVPALWIEISGDIDRRAARDTARRAAVVESREMGQPHLFDVLPGVTEAVVPLFADDRYLGHVCVGPVIAIGVASPKVPAAFADLTHMTMRQLSALLNLVARAVEPILAARPKSDEPELFADIPSAPEPAGRAGRHKSRARPEQFATELFVMARFGRVREAVRAFSRERLNGEPVSEPARTRILSDILLLADCCGKAGVPSADVALWTQHATSGLQTSTTNAAVTDIVSELLGSVRRSGRASSPRCATRLRCIAAHVEHHMGDHLSAREVADALGLTPRQTVNTVRALTGVSFVSFVTALRMARARTLLSRTRLTVAEISDRLGFSYESYFSRVFTRQVGEPPTRFRRRLKSNGQTALL